MDYKEVLAALRSFEVDLRNRGVAHASLLKATALNDLKCNSHITIIVHLDPRAAVNPAEYCAITRFLADIIPIPMQVENYDKLQTPIRQFIDTEVACAF